MDKGLGKNYGDIYRNCQLYATTELQRNIAARTLVVSPELDFMNAIPSPRRVAILAELTEATMDRWFEAMNLPTAEHSYVIHRGLTKDKLPDGTDKSVVTGREFLHSHVVLAPTITGFETDRQRYWVGKKQLPLLHQASRDAMEHIWTRELGVEKVQQLNLALEGRTNRFKHEQEQTKLAQLTPDSGQVDRTMHDLYQQLDMPLPPSPDSRDIDSLWDIDR